MLPIYVSYDSGMDQLERRAITDGMIGTMRAFESKHNVMMYGVDRWSEHALGSADWCVMSCRSVYRVEGKRTQQDALHLIDLLFNNTRNDPKPHINVLFTSHDLTMRDENGDWVDYVLEMFDGQNYVCSLAQFRHIADDCDRKLAIQAIVAHGLGHAFGMTYGLRRSFRTAENGAACVNCGCAMQNSVLPVAWVRIAHELRHSERVFCSECISRAQENERKLENLTIREEIWN